MRERKPGTSFTQRDLLDLSNEFDLVTCRSKAGTEVVCGDDAVSTGRS